MLILCNGMIRSGSTVQYNLVMALVERLGVGEGIGFIDSEHAVTHEAIKRYAGDNKVFVAKSHHPIMEIGPFCETGDAVLCYTYRHLLDVAGSAKTKFGWPWKDVLKGIDQGIAAHRMARQLPNSVIQEYEDLTTDLTRSVAYLDKQLGFGGSPELYAEIAQANSVDEVIKKMHTMKGAANRRQNIRRALHLTGLLPLARCVNHALPSRLRYTVTVDSKTNIHHNHISEGRGKVGASRQCLTPEEAEEVSRRFGDYLQEMGYSLSGVLGN